MLFVWMLMASLFTLCIGAAAYAADRLRRTQRRSTRGVWASALAVAVIWPFAVTVMRPLVWTTPATPVVAPGMNAALAPVAASATVAPSASWFNALVAHMVELPLMVERTLNTIVQRSPWLVPAALITWAVVSAMLLLRLLLASRRIHALTRTATRTAVDQHDVLLAEGFGPASVGVFAPRIVLPQWVLSLDAPLRALVLQHEREHCMSGDPRYVWSAALATALIPWNPGVWWMSRRLRLALELDCDARTLRHGGDPLVYAKLLLFMTQQHATPASHLRLASSLAASRSHLSRRIVAMQQGAITSSRTVRLALGGAAVLSLVAACGTRIPGNVLAPQPPANESLAAVQTRADSARAAVAPTAASAQSKPYFEFQVEKPAAMVNNRALQYPPTLRSAQVEGTVLASFVVDEQGVVDLSTFKVLRSDHELFTQSVREALPQFTYSAAELGGTRVKQVVQQPFMFSLNKPASPTAEQIEQVLSARKAAISAARDGTLPMKPSDPSLPYFEYQVEKPAAMSPGASGMVYPPELRSARVEGKVLASFVVDVNGNVELNTFKVLRSDHGLFTEAVKEALQGMKYQPAEVEGQRVRQLVQQPFHFALPR